MLFMKILWFTNTPCSAAEKLGVESHRGGWLKSLELQMNVRPEVQLSICFYSTVNIDPFLLGGTMYYPLYRKSLRSKLSRYVRRMKGNLGNDHEELKRLLDVVKLVKPDLIHIHGTEENFGLIQSKIRIPVVISIQGILGPYVEKFYAGIPSADAKRHESFDEKINFKSAHYLRKNMLAKARREKDILQQSSFIVGRTDWDRRVTRLLAPSSQYFYNSEILREAFYQRVWQKTRFNDVFTILTISSSALYKGFETIIRTAQLLNEHSKLRFRWLVVGLHQKSGVVKLVKKMTATEPADLGVELSGARSEPEILDLMMNADLYCQVSHIENSPNSLCEAMLTGMPVLASYAGGTASLVANGTDGLLVQDGDAYAIAGAIMELAADYPTAAAYGSNARKRALERHNKQTIANDLANIYFDIKKLHEPTTTQSTSVHKNPVKV